MKEVNEEIKLTINIMQSDIDDGLREEMQKHLNGLLEIKRNELQKELTERSWSEPVKHDASPYNSPIKLYGYITDEVKPLTANELKAGGWWCADVSAECANAFESKGLQVFNSDGWGEWNGCTLLSCDGKVTRGLTDPENKKQIKRIGNDFYWVE